MSENTTYGRAISLSTAETLLNYYNSCHENVIKRKSNEPNLPKGIDIFMENDKNAFMFSKESMLDLIQNKGADYILVVLGAHSTDEAGGKIKEGSFTVMTIGYTKDEEWKGKGSKFKVIEDLDPGYQYPPKQVVIDLNEVQIQSFLDSNEENGDIVASTRESGAFVDMFLV